MMTLRRWVLITALACAALAMPAGSGRATAAERVLGGELVVLDGNPNRFRIVGHPGTFAAPKGMDLSSLDGRPVEVEIGDNGRVLSITERPVPITPITTGWETVRGQLVARDGRTFTFAGDAQVYTAPPNIDITPYAGRWVEVRINPQGQVGEIKLIPEPRVEVPPYVPPPAAVPVAPPPLDPTCTYGAQGYSMGATVCQSGTQFRCENGAWRNLGVPCGVAPPAADRTCMYAGATVASGSSICRDGISYRCSDGAWINLQTACR